MAGTKSGHERVGNLSVWYIVGKDSADFGRHENGSRPQQKLAEVNHGMSCRIRAASASRRAAGPVINGDGAPTRESTASA